MSKTALETTLKTISASKNDYHPKFVDFETFSPFGSMCVYTGSLWRQVGLTGGKFRRDMALLSRPIGLSVWSRLLLAFVVVCFSFFVLLQFPYLLISLQLFMELSSRLHRHRHHRRHHLYHHISHTS